jgi:hypothetical protein
LTAACKYGFDLNRFKYQTGSPHEKKIDARNSLSDWIAVLSLLGTCYPREEVQDGGSNRVLNNSRAAAANWHSLPTSVGTCMMYSLSMWKMRRLTS